MLKTAIATHMSMAEGLRKAANGVSLQVVPNVEIKTTSNFFL
jgi:hypothetical protein